MNFVIMTFFNDPSIEHTMILRIYHTLEEDSTMVQLCTRILVLYFFCLEDPLCSLHFFSPYIDTVGRVSVFISLFNPPGSAFIKPDQLDPWIKDQIKITLLSTISHLQLLNFVSCGRDKPSHMTQNLVTVGAELWTAECFLVDPWSMD